MEKYVGTSDIEEEAIKFYQQLLVNKAVDGLDNKDLIVLVIPKCVSEEDNKMLMDKLSIEEIKKVVFANKILSSVLEFLGQRFGKWLKISEKIINL